MTGLSPNKVQGALLQNSKKKRKKAKKQKRNQPHPVEAHQGNRLTPKRHQQQSRRVRQKYRNPLLRNSTSIKEEQKTYMEQNLASWYQRKKREERIKKEQDKKFKTPVRVRAFVRVLIYHVYITHIYIIRIFLDVFLMILLIVLLIFQETHC